MAKINGTTLLVYADGELIAAQKNVTITTSQNLFDTSNKESAGWAEHENGQRSSEISIDGLASTTGLSSEALFDYIISRKSLVLVCEGFDYPIVCQADVTSSSITGPTEDATTISGSFKVNGRLFYLQPGLDPNLVTAPDGNGANTAYDTLTATGISITSAVNAAGDADVFSNSVSITDTNSYMLFVFLTLNSGQAPSVNLRKNSDDSDISNVEVLAAGFNAVTLIADETTTGALKISNTGATNFSTSNIYLFAL